MKKIVLILLALMLCSLDGIAQDQSRHHRPRGMRDRHTPPPANQIIVRSENNETFSLYLDGRPQSSRGRREFTLVGLDEHPHVLFVRLQAPADRIAAITIAPTEFNHVYAVSYNNILDRVIITDLSTGQPTRPYSGPDDGEYSSGSNRHEGRPIPPHAAESEMDEIIGMMTKTPYDTEKTTLGKTFLKSHRITTDQAIRMAKTITYDSYRLELLLYAYDSCVDPENYFKCTDLLSYKTSKDKLLDKINANSGHRHRR